MVTSDQFKVDPAMQLPMRVMENVVKICKLTAVKIPVRHELLLDDGYGEKAKI
jgi:hypothetical protein